MQQSDFYFTVQDKEVVTEIKIKGSKLIAYAYHVGSVGQAEELLSMARKKYYDATHVCYAFLIRENEFKYSDDGEPSGTAGPPILNAINHHHLQETLVIVVRYFGGTKLGTGGLIRAYFQAADEVLKSAIRIKKIIWKELYLEAGYTYYNQIMKLLEKYEGKPGNLKFSDKVSGKVLLPASVVSEFIKELTEISAANVVINKIGA